MPDQILVTGASGLLGSEFAAQYSALGAVTGWFNSTPVAVPRVSMRQVDLMSLPSKPTLGVDENTDLIVHCAAATNVDWCESNRQETFEINSATAELLANRAKQCGAKFVLISTDSVFDGELGNYSESDPTSPINVYAESKVDAEARVLAVNEQSLVVRCNFFGRSPTGNRSLMEWVLNRANSGQEVPGFTDSTFSPLAVPDLVGLVIELVDKDCSGIIHVGSACPVTKYEFAIATLEAFKQDPNLAVESSAQDVDFAAKRPKNTSLNIDLLESILKRPVPSVRDGLDNLSAT